MSNYNFTHLGQAIAAKARHGHEFHIRYLAAAVLQVLTETLKRAGLQFAYQRIEKK